jgi:hypothetical protein
LAESVCRKAAFFAIQAFGQKLFVKLPKGPGVLGGVSLESLLVAIQALPATLNISSGFAEGHQN